MERLARLLERWRSALGAETNEAVGRAILLDSFEEQLRARNLQLASVRTTLQALNETHKQELKRVEERFEALTALHDSLVPLEQSMLQRPCETVRAAQVREADAAHVGDLNV